jgi:hypothetical protein
MKVKLLALVVLFSSLFLASSALASPYSQRTCSDGPGNSVAITINEGHVGISSFGLSLTASIGNVGFCYPLFYGQSISLEIKGYSESELIYYDIYYNGDGWQCTKDWSFTIPEGIPTVKVDVSTSFDSIPFGRSSVSCSLMSKYEGDPGPSPTITITSPKNCTDYPICKNSSYYKNYVPLNFIINEPIFPFTIKYSLDGQPNIAVNSPIALSSIQGSDNPISDGFHNITVYAIDLLGNQEKSDTIYFSYCLGDITGPGGIGDKRIDARDVAFASSLFGVKSCTDSKYDTRADLNDDCKINAKDVALIAKLFGKRCS